MLKMMSEIALEEQVPADQAREDAERLERRGERHDAGDQEQPTEARVEPFPAIDESVVTGFTSPLEIQDRPVPVPAAGQVLVRIEASGLCHTDIHAAHGDWPVKPTPPFVPGHEGVGIVEALGAGVTTAPVGERVAMPWLGHACGHCEYCVSGWETLCEPSRTPATRVDGALRRVRRRRRATTSSRCPDGVSPLDAAPLTCAGVTTYKAIKVAGVRPDRAGRGLRRRRPGPPRRAVRRDRRRHRHRRRRGARPSSTWPPSSAPTTSSTRATTDPVAAIEQLGGADVAVVLAA